MLHYDRCLFRSPTKVPIMHIKSPMLNSPIEGEIDSPPAANPAPGSHTQLLDDIRDAPSQLEAQENLLDSYTVPSIVTLPYGAGLDYFPTIANDEGALQNPAARIGSLVTPVDVLGTKYLVNPTKTIATGAVSNLDFVKIKRLIYLDAPSRKRFFDKWLKKHDFSLPALNLYHTMFGLEISTQRGYIRKVAQLEKFWIKKYPYLQELSFAQIISRRDITHMLVIFLHNKSDQGVALGTLKQYTTALNFARKLLGFSPIPNPDFVGNATRAIARTKCRKPKGTKAIPLKSFRRFLRFLKRKGPRTHAFIGLSFWAGSRASEAVSINTESFYFYRNSQGKRAVKLTFFRTKTKKRYVDDHHTVNFVESSRNIKFCAYRLSAWFCQNFREGTFLAPFPVEDPKNRLPNLYKWFNRIKKEFSIWHQDIFDNDIDTHEWRFHSFRTTLIGYLKRLGLDWGQIQMRVGHVLDSKTTREVYYMNAIMTEGFDQTFEELLEKKSAQGLLLGEDSDDLTSEDEKFSCFSDSQGQFQQRKISNKRSRKKRHKNHHKRKGGRKPKMLGTKGAKNTYTNLRMQYYA